MSSTITAYVTLSPCDPAMVWDIMKHDSKVAEQFAYNPVFLEELIKNSFRCGYIEQMSLYLPATCTNITLASEVCERLFNTEYLYFRADTLESIIDWLAKSDAPIYDYSIDKLMLPFIWYSTRLAVRYDSRYFDFR